MVRRRMDPRGDGRHEFLDRHLWIDTRTAHAPAGADRDPLSDPGPVADSDSLPGPSIHRSSDAARGFRTLEEAIFGCLTSEESRRVPSPPRDIGNMSVLNSSLTGDIYTCVPRCLTAAAEK